MALAGVIVGTVVYLAGRHDGRRAERRELLDRAGYTRGCARRYPRAAAILERLDGSRDKAGVLAGDTLSADTYRMVTAWVADHREEFPT